MSNHNKSRAIVSWQSVKTIKGFSIVSPQENIVDIEEIYIWPDNSISLKHCAKPDGEFIVATGKIDMKNIISIQLIR